MRSTVFLAVFTVALALQANAQTIAKTVDCKPLDTTQDVFVRDTEIEAGRPSRDLISTYQNLRQRLESARAANEGSLDFPIPPNLLPQAMSAISGLYSYTLNTPQKPALQRTARGYLERAPMVVKAFMDHKTYLNFVNAMEVLSCLTGIYDNQPQLVRYAKDFADKVRAGKEWLWPSEEGLSAQEILSSTAAGIFLVEVNLGKPNTGFMAIHDMYHASQMTENLSRKQRAWIGDLLVKLDNNPNPLFRRYGILQLFTAHESPYWFKATLNDETKIGKNEVGPFLYHDAALLYRRTSPGVKPQNNPTFLESQEWLDRARSEMAFPN